LFIKGSYGSWGGNNIFKIYDNQLINNAEKIYNLYHVIIKSGYLFQETISQHPEMDRLNSSCMNTLRMDTFIDSDGKIANMSAYLRTSINNHWVDNIGQGGCYARIDPETGIVNTGAYFGFLKDLGQPLTQHPVTHTKFEGFNIPYFKEAKELVIQAASYMTGLRLIGWDIGISETGPVLIEGNPDYSMGSNDFAAGGYRSNSVFKKAWEEYKSKNKDIK
jgi:hypothetical protein